MNTTFDPRTLAADLSEVRCIYAGFFAGLDATRWEQPAKNRPGEWTLHEAIAHLCALNGDALQSIKHALRGAVYQFPGLDSRYAFNAFNRKGIDHHRGIAPEALRARLLDILDETAGIARSLQPDQAELAVQMPIYNRPIRIVEALAIMHIHMGLFHTAQVAEAASLPPLWMQLAPEVRQRVIERTMRAFSLLYRQDIGGALRTTLAFRVDGPGGGAWHVELSPDAPSSGEGGVDQPGLLIHLRDTAVFCRMLTGRLNVPLTLLGGAMKLRGDLRLFLRMDSLFSVDARPPMSAWAKPSAVPSA